MKKPRVATRQDITVRNLRAMKARLVRLEHRIAVLETAMVRLAKWKVKS